MSIVADFLDLGDPAARGGFHASSTPAVYAVRGNKLSADSVVSVVLRSVVVV